MPIVHANGLDFMTEITGHGPRLVFLGGTGWDLRQRPNPLDSLLAKSFELLLFDQRGMGRSAKPAGPYTMRDYAEDAVAVMRAIGWDSAHVVGYSFGGMVAQEVAIGWPQSLRRLVLGATTAGGAGGSSYPIHELLKLDPYERSRRGLEIADLKFTRQWQTENPEAAERRVRQRMTRQTQFIDEPGARDGLGRQLQARATHDAYDRLECISAPTLVLAGEDDGQALLAYQRRMADKIPDCDLQVVAGSHNFIQENDEAYERIRMFCLAQQS